MDNQIEKPRAKGGGRPRSEATRRAILSATLFLLKSESVQSITIEAIARQAGVSKATIYRWWNSKASVAIDAFIENHLVHTPIREDLHPAEALLIHWRALAEQYRGAPGRIVAQILAEGQSDPAVLREFRQRFHYGRRAVVREVVQQIQAMHALPDGIGNEFFMDLLYAAIYMRLLWDHATIDDEFVQSHPLKVFRIVGIEFDENGHVVNA